MNDFASLALAVASVRPVLTVLMEPTFTQAEVLAVAERELARTDSTYVRRELQKGELLNAANSAFASEAFRQDVEHLLRPVLEPVTAELVRALDRVVSGQAPMTARFSSRAFSHLPRRYVQAGAIAAEDTRDLVAFALCDLVLQARWVTQQERPALSTAEGFVFFAAGSSSFVTRTGLFGQRVRTGTTEAGRPIYAFEMDVQVPLQGTAEDDSSADMSEHLVARAFGEAQDEAANLEFELQQRTAAYLGRRTGTVFNALFEEFTRALDLGAVARKRRNWAALHGVSEQEVQDTADALQRAVTDLRREVSA